MARLLLIDDDPAVIPTLVRSAFPPPDFEVDVAADAATGLDRVRQARPDVVLLDLRLPDRPGLEVLDAIRAIDARIPVVFVTIAKTADAAIAAMKRGAHDYLYKPLDLDELRRVVGEALEVSRWRSAPVVLAQPPLDGVDEGAIFGVGATMLGVYKQIGRVAAQDVTVLITGESGTGKELVARAIYQHSARASAPFGALNCAAIPEQLLESELFGHERGAFTGADRRRIGKFEQYSGGTLLLDEIGDMPTGLQAKLLRVLQEQRFERVGGREQVHTDVRLIAATNRDLRAMSADERFRGDLYYRLSVFTIHLPPLRERDEDLPILVDYFVRRFARELGKDVHEVPAETMEVLGRHHWPGNIRELQSVLKQALLQATGTMLLPSFLPSLAEATPSTRSGLGLDEFVRARLTPGTTDLYGQTHAAVDRVLLARVLEYTGGNQREAARHLGISRQTLRAKVRGLGLIAPRGDDDTAD